MTPHNSSLEQAIEVYLTHCEVEGKSLNTIVAYRETLGQFLDLAREQGFAHDVRSIAPEDIYAFLAWVRDRGVSKYTQHRRHREVRLLFAWLERLGYVEENPFRHIRNLKPPQKIINPFTEDEIQRRLLTADFLSEYLAARNRAVILLSLDIGIRLSELNSLNLEDLDLERQRLSILNGKMKKQRVVRVGSATLAALKEYLKLRGDQPGRLFLSKHMKPMRKHAIQVMLRRLAQWTGPQPQTHTASATPSPPGH